MLGAVNKLTKPKMQQGAVKVMMTIKQRRMGFPNFFVSSSAARGSSSGTRLPRKGVCDSRTHPLSAPPTHLPGPAQKRNSVPFFIGVHIYCKMMIGDKN